MHVIVVRNFISDCEDCWVNFKSECRTNIGFLTLHDPFGIPKSDSLRAEISDQLKKYDAFLVDNRVTFKTDEGYTSFVLKYS